MFGWCDVAKKERTIVKFDDKNKHGIKITDKR